MDNKTYTSVVLKITDELVPKNKYMIRPTTEEILSVIEKEIKSKRFICWILDGAYGFYIPRWSTIPPASLISLVSPSIACIKIESVYLEEDTLYAKYTIMDNPYGKIIYDNIQAGKVPIFILYNTVYKDDKTNKISSIVIENISVLSFADKEEINKLKICYKGDLINDNF